MKLTYRGIRYGSAKQHFAAIPTETISKEIVYRGNSPWARIKPDFPWLKYAKQLFSKGEPKSIFDPITFWYNHKREFITDCWRFGDRDKLDRDWNLTIQIEREKISQSQPNQQSKIKLKYRGVTYYK